MRSKFSLQGQISDWSMHEYGTNIRIPDQLRGTRNYLLVVIRRDRKPFPSGMEMERWIE